MKNQISLFSDFPKKLNEIDFKGKTKMKLKRKQ